MKQVITFLLALLVFLQPFSKIWIVVCFKINQNSIAKTLCVKREIKGNTCKGKCHLKKQLEKANKEEQKQTPTSSKVKIESLYSQRQKHFDFLNILLFENIHFDKYKSYFYPSTFIADIFRPPNYKLS